VDIPISMKTEIAAWNRGAGIDLQSWTGIEGRFALAVGYGSIFWPEFVEFDGYILPKRFSEAALRAYESREGTTRKSVECVMNHLHIADIQYYGCPDISKDKILLLGNLFKEIYEAKLKWQFPDRPCEIEFYIPTDEDDLIEYQVSFWQRCHESGE
jgi:hypothetical protein